MKIDRLIGILSVLLQEEKTTAPELAEKFEVSLRTINRDIEELCKAGIPIRTVQGTGGGISIMDGYRMDRTLLFEHELWRHWIHFHRKSCLPKPIIRGSAEAALEVILSAQRAVIMIGR